MTTFERIGKYNNKTAGRGYNMIEIASSLEGKTFPLYQLEEELKPKGFSIGGNWEYDHGYFDYQMGIEDGYHFLRIPFRAVDGQLDSHGTSVEIGRPFLLAHKYQEGLDDHSFVGNVQAAMNQFAEPADKDAEVPDKYVDLGKSLVQELEKNLLNSSTQ